MKNPSTKITTCQSWKTTLVSEYRRVFMPAQKTLLFQNQRKTSANAGSVSWAKMKTIPAPNGARPVNAKALLASCIRTV